MSEGSIDQSDTNVVGLQANVQSDVKDNVQSDVKDNVQANVQQPTQQSNTQQPTQQPTQQSNNQPEHDKKVRRPGRPPKKRVDGICVRTQGIVNKPASS